MSSRSVRKRAAESLVEKGFCSREELEGCTEGDLRSLEREYGVTLPAAYESCMRHIGRNPGRFLEGSHFTYPEVTRQTEFARERASAGARSELPDDAFVFHGLQGYTFDYFETDAGEDPPVYVFTKFDTEYESRRETDSFSEWLFREIERQATRL